MNCPSCGSADYRRSRRRGPADRLMALLLLRPFRCRNCGRRAYGYHAPLRLRARGRHAEPVRDTAARRGRPHSMRTRYERWRMRSGHKVVRRSVIAVCVLVSVLVFFWLLTYGLAFVAILAAPGRLVLPLTL